MYHGEVNVAQEELNSFLAVAEELRVKGLTQNQSSKKQETPYSAPPPKPAPSRIPDRDPLPPPKKPRPTPILQSNQHSLPPADDDDIQEVVPVKSEPREAPLVQQNQAQPAAQEMYSHALQAAEEGEYGGEEQYEDYGQYEGEGYDGQEGGDGNKGRGANLIKNGQRGKLSKLLFPAPTPLCNAKAMQWFRKQYPKEDPYKLEHI